MFTLRCTARLAKRLKVAAEGAPPPASTRLGDWYANLVHAGRHQLVVAVSEKTFLPVVIPAAPGTTVVPRLRAGLVELLRALGIPRDAVEQEEAAMQEVAYARASNRQVLGILVEFARLLEFMVEDGVHPAAFTPELANTPLSPLFKRSGMPDLETAELFGVALPRRQLAEARPRAMQTGTVPEPVSGEALARPKWLH